MTAHVLDDPGLADAARALGATTWVAGTSYGRSWKDLREDEQDEIREQTKHLVDDEILAVARWRQA